jgi:hypothetical protein
MIARTLPVVRGESDALRQRILELRFRELVMLNLDTGSPFRAQATVWGRSCSCGVRDQFRRSGMGTTPFDLTFLNSTAIMRVDTFEKEQDAEFASFVEESFARIASEKAARLIIDFETMAVVHMKYQIGC